MDPTQIYVALRSEIIANHTLMHWFTIVAALVILISVLVIERLGKTILAVFVPLLSLAWAASMARFDFFIHRQAAYLRILEAQYQTGPLQGWELWKSSLRSTPVVIPFLDLIAVGVIVVPTIYLLFGPAQEYFRSRDWRGGRIYAYFSTTILILLLVSLIFIPRLASH